MLLNLPALSENKRYRFALITLMYVAQGIQMGLMLVAIPAYLAKNGLSPAAVGGFIGATMLPWSLKIIAGPIMDRFSFLPMGRRRPWIMFGITGAAIGYFMMGFVQDPLQHIVMFTAAAVIVSSFTAFMDVAIDGLAIEIIPIQEQPKANSYMWGGKVLGAASTTAGAAWTLSAFGLQTTSLVAAFCSIVFLSLPLLMRERPGERFLPWTSGQSSPISLQLQMEGWGEIVKSLIKVIFLPASIIISLVSFLHGITYGLFDAIMPMITVQELGWDDKSFSNLAAMSGLIGGVIGFLAGDRLVIWFGRKRALTYLFFSLITAALVVGLAAAHWHQDWPIHAFVIATYLLRTLILITLFATAMALCWTPVAATQFAIYMAIGNLGISAGAALLGFLKLKFTYDQIFFVFALILFITLAILSRIKVDEHVARLEWLTDEKVAEGEEAEKTI